MREASIHPIAVVKDQYIVFAVVKEDSKEAQWSDVAIDQHRLNVLLLQRPQHGPRFAKATDITVDKQGMAQPSSNQANMVGQEHLFLFQRGRLKEQVFQTVRHICSPVCLFY
jgi:hypothetical protein